MSAKPCPQSSTAQSEHPRDLLASIELVVAGIELLRLCYRELEVGGVFVASSLVDFLNHKDRS
jgi:hypothetical protein